MIARLEFDVADLGLAPAEVEDVIETMIRDEGLSTFLRSRLVSIVGSVERDEVSIALKAVERHRLRVIELERQNATQRLLLGELERQLAAAVQQAEVLPDLLDSERVKIVH